MDKKTKLNLYEFLYIMEYVEFMDSKDIGYYGDTSKDAVKHDFVELSAIGKDGAIYGLTIKGRTLLKVLKTVETCNFQSFNSVLKLKELYENAYGKNETLDNMIKEQEYELNINPDDEEYIFNIIFVEESGIKNKTVSEYLISYNAASKYARDLYQIHNNVKEIKVTDTEGNYVLLYAE